MFADTEIPLEDLIVESKKTPEEPAEAMTAQGDNKVPDSVPIPVFLKQMNDIYRANGSHVFILHGNINDHPDNTGRPSNMQMLLSTVYDTFWLQEKLERTSKKLGKIAAASALTRSCPVMLG